jgi:hypothetical protein
MNKLLIFFILVLLLFLYLYFFIKGEKFINIADSHQVYQNYRDYLDTNYNNLERQNGNIIKQMCIFNKKRPPMISSNCFTDKYYKCVKNKNIPTKVCVLNSSNICTIPIIN